MKKILSVAMALLALTTAHPASARADETTPAVLRAEVKREVVRGEGFSAAEAERLAHAQARFVVDLEGGRSYSVVRKSVSRVRDVYVCTMTIEFAIPR